MSCNIAQTQLNFIPKQRINVFIFAFIPSFVYFFFPIGKMFKFKKKRFSGFARFQEIFDLFAENSCLALILRCFGRLEFRKRWKFQVFKKQKKDTDTNDRGFASMPNSARNART